jgi:hypothetical protein
MSSELYILVYDRGRCIQCIDVVAEQERLSAHPLSPRPLVPHSSEYFPSLYLSVPRLPVPYLPAPYLSAFYTRTPEVIATPVSCHSFNSARSTRRTDYECQYEAVSALLMLETSMQSEYPSTDDDGESDNGSGCGNHNRTGRSLNDAKENRQTSERE